MIIYNYGNILKSSAEALVNPVNCLGIMGKGLAYQFRKQFPLNNEEYKKICKMGYLKIGRLHYYKEKEKTIINFPTKFNWREKSKYEYIEKGLNSLVKLIIKEDLKSIAIPPLGCGLGGLEWENVHKIILDKVKNLESITVYIYLPH